jgi:CubicO group peptidase (beta-lactamase class C family)
MLPATLPPSLDAGGLRGITSLVAARHGEIVLEWYADGEPDALRDTRSVTKTVAGMLIGIAIDRGAISGVDAPLLAFFDDLAPIANDGPAKRSITLHDILTMSSVLDCDDGDPASPGSEEVMYETPDWLRFALEVPTRDAGDAGAFRYCTAGVTALAGVVERATGDRVEDYADAHLFGPLGISDLSWFRTPTGLVQTGGGLRLRSRDLLALGQSYLDGGTHDDTRIVSSEWVEASFHPHVQVDDATSYGYLWWLRDLSLPSGTTRSAMMQGNGGSKVAVLQDLDAVAVITSTNYNTPGMHQQTDDILVDHLVPMLSS